MTVRAQWDAERKCDFCGQAELVIGPAARTQTDLGWTVARCPVTCQNCGAIVQVLADSVAP